MLTVPLVVFVDAILVLLVDAMLVLFVDVLLVLFYTFNTPYNTFLVCSLNNFNKMYLIKSSNLVNKTLNTFVIQSF